MTNRTSPSQFIDSRYQILFWPLFASFMIFGVGLVIIGALLPRILADFHWSYTSAGFVIAANSVGYFTSTFLAGILIQRFGLRPVIVSGLVLQAFSLFFFGVSPLVGPNMILTFFVGVGQGTTEIVVNTSVVRMERHGQSHLMAIMHAAFSVGAIAGPVAIGVIVAQRLPWQGVYRVIAVVAISVAAVMSFIPFGRLHEEVKSAERVPVRSLMRNPVLTLSFMALLLYVGIEIGVTNWVSEYFVTVFRSPASTGAFMVSLFWIGMLSGRLVMPILYRGPKIAESLTGLAVIYTVSLTCAIVMPGPVTGGFFFFLTSLGCSAYYPRMMTLLGQSFKSGQSIAVGFAATGGGIGMLTIPLAMSAISQGFGVRVGFVLYAFAGILLAAVSYLIVLQVRRGVPA